MSKLLLSTLLFMTLSWSAQSFAASECEALKAEVKTLRAKLATYEAGQRANTPSAALSPPAVLAAPAVATALPGTAAKPAAITTVVVELPYSRSGCREGLFTPIAPARWQDTALWGELETGQSAAEVEVMLGVEHFDEAGGDNVIWHYGRCGPISKGQVLFTNGKLADWRTPKR